MSELTPIQAPLQQMIGFVVQNLAKYGISPVELTPKDAKTLWEEGLILQQTFEFKNEVSAEDEDTVNRALHKAGWDTEWNSDGDAICLCVTLDGWDFHDESVRSSEVECYLACN
jgi:hypothetical protein